MHFPKFRSIHWGGLLAIALLMGSGFLVMGFLGRKRVEPQAQLRDPLPQDPQIQVYFNHAESAAYTDPYRQQYRLGDDLEQMVITAIREAHRSIDLAVHELNLPNIAAALAERQQAGVKVRLIVENTYRKPLSAWTTAEIQADDRSREKYQNFAQLVDQNQNGQLEAQEIVTRDAMAMLQTASIPIQDDTADGSKGSDLMHHKFLVIDRKTVITGSANLTWSDIHGDFSNPQSQGNANHLLKIENAGIAQLFTQEFNLMWGKGDNKSGKFGLKKPYRSAQTIRLSPQSQITVQFSPTSSKQSWSQSVNGLIGRSLQQAKHSVDMALFVFSDQQLSNVLETEARQGVKIRALIDPSFAFRDYSEGLDLLGVSLANSRCRVEADNHPWKQPITTVGMPQLPQGDLLHHKLALLDGKQVITGSQNWSDAANHSNDENLLVITNATVAAHFQREFDRLYHSATLGISSQLQEKQKQQQARCRT